MSSSGTPEKSKKSFRETLNLPQTDFNMRAKAATTEPAILDAWKKEDVYTKSLADREGKEKFIFHDGPPYANGHSHIGHAFSRTLRDIVCKSQRMEGKQVYFTPGWDCHGLPIELKVVQQNPELADNADPVALKKACRTYASDWIEKQSEEFQRLGVTADWDNYYATMNPEYEASILNGFARFVEQDYIQRRQRTIPWCSSCQTTLATAEIEYKDRKDPATYLYFKLTDDSAVKLSVDAASLNFLVWTTTPWTLPLNRGLVIHPDADYVVVKTPENKAFVIGADLAQAICDKADIPCDIVKKLTSKDLLDLLAHHPTDADRTVPVISDDMVSLKDGTAIVHSAPGCGPEDYLIGIKNNLEIFSPLSPDGCYTPGIKPAELEGVKVTDGQWAMLKKIKADGNLFFKENLTHSYPHCWRCHEGLMFRATKQWFCDLSRNDLTGQLMKETENINFVPAWGKTRFQSFIENRAEWCISRQRKWGVPIPALKCADCDSDAIMNADLIRFVANEVETKGIEYWDTVTVEQLVASGHVDKNATCKVCKSSNWCKEMDILDVWFDSGVSHLAVLAKDPQQGVPADLYLEGSDQHRGWFQSSLFSSMIIHGKPCAKTIVTHGFVVDSKRHKMSKSVGNVIAPSEMIDKYGADVLRLWTAAADFERDVVISKEIFASVAEVYRKIRNTCRFMLSNLYDFDEQDNLLQTDVAGLKGDYPLGLSGIDRYILGKLAKLNREVREDYKAYRFTTIFQKLNTFCANDLSACYLDIVKDRLYIEKQNDALRKSAQKTITLILTTITRLMAPILSFLAEEVTTHHDKNKQVSVHRQEFVNQQKLDEIISGWDAAFEKDADGALFWQSLEQVRGAILKAIEEQRSEGLIRHSLEASIIIAIDSNNEQGKQFTKMLQGFERCEGINRFLSDWVIVSQFEIIEPAQNLDATSVDWLSISVAKANGVKCPRCWHWTVLKNNHEDGLCDRCQAVIS